MRGILIFSFIILMGLLMDSNSAQAAATCTSAAACNGALITKLYVNGTGDVYFAVDGDMTLVQPTCTLYNGYFVLPTSLPNFKVIYATMLASKLTAQPMTIRLTTSGTCAVSYVTM